MATYSGIYAFRMLSVYTFLELASQREHTGNRGGVSRMVGGPSAASYCYLLDSYTSTGAQPNIGAHQVGEVLNGIPLFKVPSSIIPNDRILTVFFKEDGIPYNGPSYTGRSH